METTTENSDQDDVTEEAGEITEDLAQLLDEHDYDTPSVGDIRTGIIVSITPQGVIVDLGLKRDGLVEPSDLSELDDGEREAFQLNDEVPVYILETNQPDRLLVSIHKARLNQDWIRAQEMMDSEEVFEEPVIGYNRGGIIVPFGKLRGFVPASHLTDLRRGMDDRQRQQVMSKMRDEVLPLKVIEVNRRRRRLVMSQRDAQKEWQETRKEELISSLKAGDVLTGRVSGLRNFGAFVDLGGADGLIHISELAWHRVNHPREVIRVGDEVEVYVLSLDKEEQRIALSRKRMLPNPWSLAEDKYAINHLVEGFVTRIVSYGAFVEIEPGIEGLLHISQISRETIEEPQEVIAEGETHLLRIISLDPDRQRVGLSLKSVTANEQIEWMSRREMEKAEAEAEAAKAAAEQAVLEVVTEAEVAKAEAEEAVVEAVAEAAVVEAIAEEAIEEAVAEAAVVEAIAEEAIEEAVAEAVVIEAAAEAKIEEAETETEVAEAVAEAKVLEAVAEAKVVEAVAEAKVVEAAAEANVAETVAAAAVAETVAKAAIVKALVEEEVVEAEAEAAIVEAVAEAAVVEAAVEEITTEAAEIIAELESLAGESEEE